MIYLNDDFNEGETIFDFGDTIKLKKGRLFMFFLLSSGGKLQKRRRFAEIFLNLFTLCLMKE